MAVPSGSPQHFTRTIIIWNQIVASMPAGFFNQENEFALALAMYRLPVFVILSPSASDPERWKRGIILE